MTIIRELVTLLRYKVDESGLKKDAQVIQSWWRRVVGIGRAQKAELAKAFEGQAGGDGALGNAKAALEGSRVAARQVAQELGVVRSETDKTEAAQKQVNAAQKASADNLKAVGRQQASLTSWWRQAVGLGRAASEGWRQGVRGVLNEYGLVPGRVIRGIIEQRRLNREQRESAKNVKAVGRQYTALAGTIRNLFGAYLGFEGIKGFLNAGDEFGQIEARLKNATSSYGEFIAVDKELAANSRESYKPFAANAELFIRTNDVMKALGKTTRDTLDVVSATNLSLAASGATADKASSFIDQFSKDLGLGALSANGFQSMVANNQRMLKYLVDGLNETHPALGATMANFQKLVKEGKITTNVMIPALRSQMAKMRKDVEDMPVSRGDALTVFRDKVARVSWAIEQQYGIIRKMTTALGFLGDNLREILHLLWLAGMSWGMARLSAGVAALAGKGASLSKIFRSLVGLAGVLIKRFWKFARPFLPWLFIMEAIHLIFDDVMTWLRGGESLLGTIIGRSEKWKNEIQAVRDALTQVKNLLGGGDQELGKWVAKWGTLSVLATGLGLILWKIGKVFWGIGKLVWGLGTLLWGLRGPLFAIGRFLLRWLVAPVLSAIAAVIGWPALLGIALAAMVALVIAKFDVIRDFINGVWDNVTGYFSKKWDEALKWLEGKLKSVLPDGWVLSKEEAAKQLEDVGRKLNPHAGQMGALQRPQSHYAPNQNNSIVNNTTINANTDNPAALAQAAGQAVGRATDRAVTAWRPPPNVEALA